MASSSSNKGKNKTTSPPSPPLALESQSPGKSGPSTIIVPVVTSIEGEGEAVEGKGKDKGKGKAVEPQQRNETAAAAGTSAAAAAAAPPATPTSTPPTQLTNLSRHPIFQTMVFGPIPDREYHEGFMRKAIEMAEMALGSDETPVGCVFVRDGEVIGRGINGTNASLNVRFSISFLIFSVGRVLGFLDRIRFTMLDEPAIRQTLDRKTQTNNAQGTRHAEFVALSEIMSRHHPSILHETDLYVTVEPCIMCASALRQYGIRSVYFGCLNDRFGGTGGVMTVHMDEGVDKPYPVYGGLFREEAIMLLRRFYVQENDKGEFD